MDHLPELERALRTAQEGFRRYNEAAFPARPPEFFALELAGEAGELANNEKRIWKGRQIAREKLADEAADVFIAVVNYANARGIDLAGAVSSKLHEIERRRLRDKEDDLPL
jgi:NTP pyrophosphatase (non-canonical NTP hydrolase)